MTSPSRVQLKAKIPPFALFGAPGENAINWALIETHWVDLMQVVLSIRAGRPSPWVAVPRGKVAGYSTAAGSLGASGSPSSSRWAMSRKNVP